MTNFERLAKNEVAKRGYVQSADPKENYLYIKHHDTQNSTRVFIDTRESNGLHFYFQLARQEYVEMFEPIGAPPFPYTATENNAVSFAGRPRSLLYPNIHSEQDVIDYIEEWFPRVEQLASLGFVKAYMNYKFVDYRDEEGIGPPVDAHIKYANPAQVIDAMFEGWSPQDHELLTTFRNVFITRYPDFEQRVLAWVKEHPNGIEREPVTTEKQQWANQQMELSARTGINQWHTARQERLAYRAKLHSAAPVKEDPVVDVTWPDIQRVLKIINYTNNTELQTELEEHFIINYHGFDTIFDPNGLIELQPQLDAIRIITKQTKLALVYEDWDHQSFDIGTHTIATNLKPNTPFTFDTKTEGTEQALQAFKTWLETHTQLTLTKFLSGNEEHAHLIHPKHTQQNLIKALNSINIITNYPQ